MGICRRQFSGLAGAFFVAVGVLPIGGVQIWAAAPATAPMTAPAANPELMAIVTMLTTLGYTPKDIGSGSYEVKDVVKDLTIYVDLSLSADGSVVWLRSSLGTYDLNAIPRQVLINLLTADTYYGPSKFDLTDVGGGKVRIYLDTVIDWAGMTPAALKGAITSQENAVSGTEGYWDPSKWPKAETK